MLKLPKVIVSSVIRSTYQGESHGGIYIVDLEDASFKQVIDWNDSNINWDGRGGDRGLRGMAFYNSQIYLAASNEIFVFDPNFKLIKSFSNPYLQHCHEIFIHQDKLFLTSTGFDSLLEYDLASEVFTTGYQIRYRGLTNRDSKLLRILYRLRVKPRLHIFDPNSNIGLQAADTLHINNVFYENNSLYFSGVNLGKLYAITGNKLKGYAYVPFKTHNARPFKNGTLINDTANNRIASLGKNGEVLEVFNVTLYPEEKLMMAHFPEDHARQAFARGLCERNGLIIGGSSPAKISAYKLNGGPEPIKTVSITMDVRNAIHGLEFWDF